MSHGNGHCLASAIRRSKRGRAMIKDILVNLSVGKPRDVAGDLAISVAALFQAHLSAMAFAFDPAIGGTIMGSETRPSAASGM